MSAPPIDPNEVVVTFSDDSMGMDSAPRSALPPDPPPEPKPRRTGRRVATDKKTPTAGKTKPAAPEYRSGVLVAPLRDLYASIGMVVVPFDETCGTAILSNAESCAKALDAAAKENEALRRTLHKLIETSVLGAVIAAHFPILYAIAQHHVPAMNPQKMNKESQQDGPPVAPHIVRDHA